MDQIENLYIRIENGIPVNHPVLESNLLQLFGEIPNNYFTFKRNTRPTSDTYGPYKKVVGETATYQFVDGIWQDVWEIVDLTPDEILQKQNEIKSFHQRSFLSANFKSWIFSEEKCKYIPPIDMPNDGQEYFWQDVTGSWRIRPSKPVDSDTVFYMLNLSTWEWQKPPKKPNDGKNYILDQVNWIWIEITE